MPDPQPNPAETAPDAVLDQTVRAPTEPPVEPAGGPEPGAAEQNEIDRLLSQAGPAAPVLEGARQESARSATPASGAATGLAGGAPSARDALTPLPDPFSGAGASSAGSLASADGTLGDVLSQSEVERLLTQVQAEETVATVVKSGGGKGRLKSEDIQPCDFRQPAFLTGSELRKIRLRHEEFIRSLAAHLAVYLRLEVIIQMSKLQTLSYQKYAESLPNPTHLILFKVEPLRGVCLLDMSPRLGLTLVDRLLGGPAHSVTASGDLSEIETALLDQVAQIILNEWCQLWSKIENARPVLLGHESNGRFLNAAHDSVMLILSMEVRLGDCVEQMQLAFPFLTIEPLVRSSSAAENESAPPASKQDAPQWNRGFDEVMVNLHTQWQGLELSTRDLSKLKCGDVLLLEGNCFERVEVRLEQLPKFFGRLGTAGDHSAVELTEVVKA